MNDLTSQVEADIRARRLFRDGQQILAAVSGGLDSMALLHILHRLSKKHRWKLTVGHFNHQLRGAAGDADERLARRTARTLQLPFAAGRGDVRGFARRNGLSVEMAARQLRHEFLAKTAAQRGIGTVALAHHADDQVELFFLRLLRGAGGEGLAGMKWSNPSPHSRKIRLARPLLALPKAALQDFARENKIAFLEDASNASPGIQRNRIRHELIPLLTREYQPALARSLLRVMEVVGAESEFAAHAARQWLRGSQTPAFKRLPVAVQRRIIHQQLLKKELPPDFDLIERLRRNPGQWMNVNAGQSVCRNADGTLRLRHLERLEFSPDRRQLSLRARERQVTFGGLKIHWKIADNNNGTSRARRGNVEYFDADKVRGPICLRRWQPGDRFQPIGTGSARKLQDLFTNLKVPRTERRWRVVAATRAGELFWVEGLRMAEKFKLDKNTARRLKWSWQRYGKPELS